MGKQVKIRVQGMQTGKEGEEIVTQTEGMMQYKAPFYYVSYEEKLDTESDTLAKTVLKFSDKMLRVTRKGIVESVLEFEEGSLHNSLYMTQLGNFDVLLNTRQLSIQNENDVIHIEVEYQIGLNGMVPTDGRIEIQIEKA